MRYRVTLIKEAIPSFEVVIYREFEELEGGKNQSFMAKEMSSVARVHSEVSEEMSYQSAFAIKAIEELPAV
ncbi:MAG: hypothetical protein ABSF83_14760 [Nitrososphaerales archaeon]|jgi:hypothetical protein